jgi:hypothetical protein
LFSDPHKTHKYTVGRTYRAVNTLRLGYKNQSVNAVQWNNWVIPRGRTEMTKGISRFSNFCEHAYKLRNCGIGGIVLKDSTPVKMSVWLQSAKILLLRAKQWTSALRKTAFLSESCRYRVVDTRLYLQVSLSRVPLPYQTTICADPPTDTLPQVPELAITLWSVLKAKHWQFYFLSCAPRCPKQRTFGGMFPDCDRLSL